MEVLAGHVSPDTAYHVTDYPHGFRLRCQIRYWLEYKKGHGYRLMSQTSNPKRPGLVWNKPKGSTYSMLGVMFLDAQAHVQWDCLNLYASDADIDTFLERYRPALEADPKAGTVLGYLKALNAAMAARRAAREVQA